MENRGRLPLLAVAAGIFGIVLNISTFKGPFLEFDDQFFILTDRAIRNPGKEELVAIFTKPYFANFHPVTRLSYAVDHALWGFDPQGFHATSLFLYGLGCGLVFLFLHRLLRHPWAAFMGALLFAAHTTHVEVVASRPPATAGRDSDLAGQRGRDELLADPGAHRTGCCPADQLHQSHQLLGQRSVRMLLRLSLEPLHRSQDPESPQQSTIPPVA